MRRFTCLFLFVLCSSVAPAEDFFGEEDLLADDEMSFDSGQDLSDSKSWWDDTRFTLEQDLSQGDTLQILRSHFRFEYESAPWEGAYIKIDNKLSYFWHKDRQADQQDTDYGYNKLNEAWFQISHQECFAKLGRQALLWGSVEGAFAVDVVAPFDYTEPLLTDFSSIRLSQDLLNIECFYEDQQLQVFVQPRAKLDRFQHRQDGSLRALEKQLNEEWGTRYMHSWEGLDLHLMYARLYGNTPQVQLSPAAPFEVPRYDFFGLTLVKAIRRLLIEADIAFKPNQLEAFSGDEKDILEIALGFEYTTASNHQWNGGLWQFEAQPLAPTEQLKRARAWTLGWSNTYLNDDLTMSLLGTYLSKPKQSSLTLQSQYQWDDFWAFAAALGYSDINLELPSGEPGWQLNLNAKWQY